MKKLAQMTLAMAAAAQFGMVTLDEGLKRRRDLGYSLVAAGTPKQGKRNAHRHRRVANKRARKARILNAQIRRGAQ